MDVKVNVVQGVLRVQIKSMSLSWNEGSVMNEKWKAVDVELQKVSDAYA